MSTQNKNKFSPRGDWLNKIYGQNLWSNYLENKYLIAVLIILTLIIIIIISTPSVWSALNIYDPIERIFNLINDLIIPTTYAEEIEYFNIYSEHLPVFKDYYCDKDKLYKALCWSLDFPNVSDDPYTYFQKIDYPGMQSFGRYKMKESSFLLEYFYRYKDLEGNYVKKLLIEGWPEAGIKLPVKKEYADEVFNILKEHKHPYKLLSAAFARRLNNSVDID